MSLSAQPSNVVGTESSVAAMENDPRYPLDLKTQNNLAFLQFETRLPSAFAGIIDLDSCRRPLRFSERDHVEGQLRRLNTEVEPK